MELACDGFPFFIGLFGPAITHTHSYRHIIYILYIYIYIERERERLYSPIHTYVHEHV
jgi:hypothetical protein